MPRKARMDVPGYLYHVISRGNERREIFQEELDYGDFLSRFRGLLAASGGRCLGWCLMPNHFHLVILRGERPLSELMQRLLTGYAVSFNLRHGRVGHLFQNRYKTIICAADAYLKELIPYVHLNPLRAGLVKDIPGLSGYRWCGHAALIGTRPADFVDRARALSYFGATSGNAVKNYVSSIVDSYAGQQAGQKTPLPPQSQFSECDGPGTSEAEDGFEGKVQGKGAFSKKLQSVENMRPGIMTKDELLEKIKDMFGVDYGEIVGLSRERRISSARAAYCFLAKERCGVKGGELARELGLSASGISLLSARGRGLVGVK